MTGRWLFVALGLRLFVALLLSPVGSIRLTGLRVNRALRATHSRRDTNRLISEGRLFVNDARVTNPDSRLREGDVVRLDDLRIAWEEGNLAPHRYLKCHKPVGAVTTCDRRVRGNLFDVLMLDGGGDHERGDGDHQRDGDAAAAPARRIYPIGRLDANSTGLLLLTSDGAIVNDLLRAAGDDAAAKPSTPKRKVYHVVTVPRASDEDVARLAAGVVITAIARRDGESVPVTAPTLPCVVERLVTASTPSEHASGDDELRFVLAEGRNRQIRRMCAALGLEVGIARA